MSIFDRLNNSKVGNWLMDAEHRQLVVLMEDVEAAIAAGKDEGLVQARFDKLIAWAAQHFAHENETMLHSGYDRAGPHAEQHRALIQSLSDYAVAPPQQLDRRQRALAAVQFLETWLIKHIDEEDAHFAAYLSNKGMQ